MGLPLPILRPFVVSIAEKTTVNDGETLGTANQLLGGLGMANNGQGEQAGSWVEAFTQTNGAGAGAEPD